MNCFQPETWHLNLAATIASPDYLSLGSFSCENDVMKHSARLFATALTVLSNRLTATKCDSASNLIRGAMTLAAHGRTGNQVETVSNLVRRAYMLGVREYCRKYTHAVTPDPVHRVCADVLVALDTIENSIAVPGNTMANETFGTSISSILIPMKSLVTSIQSRWANRFRKWKNMPLVKFMKLDADQRSKVERLNSRLISNTVEPSESAQESKTRLESTHRDLCDLLVTERNVRTMAIAQKSTRCQAQDHLDKALEHHKTIQLKLENLERQYHAARHELKNAAQHATNWTKCHAEESKKEQSYQQELQEIRTRIQESATAFVTNTHAHVDELIKELPL